MNYSVHTVMYSYFAMMQFKASRAIVKRAAVFITALQLAQMIVGMLVTLQAIKYFVDGRFCQVSLLNAFMGLFMYASYFALFWRLFVSHYLRRQNAKKAE